MKKIISMSLLICMLLSAFHVVTMPRRSRLDKRHTSPAHISSLAAITASRFCGAASAQTEKTASCW